MAKILAICIIIGWVVFLLRLFLGGRKYGCRDCEKVFWVRREKGYQVQCPYCRQSYDTSNARRTYREMEEGVFAGWKAKQKQLYQELEKHWDDVQARESIERKSRALDQERTHWHNARWTSEEMGKDIGIPVLAVLSIIVFLFLVSR